MRVNFIFALGHSNKSGTYLISGGLGGLGLTVARWMVEQGVRHLVLLSRSKPAGNVQVALDAMRKTDAQVLALDVDVTKEKQVAAALAEINQSMPPLRGIIHAAGVLDDDLLLNQRRSRFVKVLSPKVAGRLESACPHPRYTTGVFCSILLGYLPSRVVRSGKLRGR